MNATERINDCVISPEISSSDCGSSDSTYLTTSDSIHQHYVFKTVHFNASKTLN